MGSSAQHALQWVKHVKMKSLIVVEMSCIVLKDVWMQNQVISYFGQPTSNCIYLILDDNFHGTKGMDLS